MKITIVNGAPKGEYADFEKILATLKDEMAPKHSVSIFCVRDMDIKYCTGCFGCWIKTPGLCVIKDQMDQILKSMLSSDLLLYASPVKAGFITANTKKIMDRTLPAVMPYIRMYDGESHHIQRYDKRPDLGILLMDDGQIDTQSKTIIFDTFDRLKKNFRPDRMVKHMVTTENLKEVLANEIRYY